MERMAQTAAFGQVARRTGAAGGAAGPVGATGTATAGNAGALSRSAVDGDEAVPRGAAFGMSPLGAPTPPASGTVPPLITAAMPVTLQGPKGGYLYARILEAGNLDALEPVGVCCDPLSGGCPGLAPCGSRPPAQLRLQFSCASLERAATTSSVASLETKTHKAVFNEELLMKSLNFCSVDVLTIKLQAKSVTLGEASMPLRVALATPLACGLPPQQASSDVHASEESAMHSIDPKQWLPTQRIVLRRPGAVLSATSAAPLGKSEPYVDVQLLQLVDGSLPHIRGTNPLMLAIEQRQEQLVRAYLSLDVAETLALSAQAACITTVIERRYHEILLLLLDRIKPLHQHLLLAIQLRAVELVEALLQASGAPLLHPHPRNTRTEGGRRGAARARHELTAAQQYIAGLRDLDEAQHRSTGSAPSSAGTRAQRAEATPTTRPRASGPRLTPLSVACSLGDVAVVEALCQWARREKVHLDPTAPPILGHDAPSVTLGGVRGADGGGANGGVALWWDQDEQHRGRGDNGSESPLYGDPPMVMAVRGQADTATKLRIISALAHYGFSADVRSPVDSWTPILAAVELGSLELVTALVKLDARLSADRHLGFTPMHLACQMGQWHLVQTLTESMCGQYSRVAAWGPSPQYVSINLVDAYGRTALDIALLRYFANPLPYADYEKSASSGSERQKAVDILREFVHRSPPEDPGIVCGWELLRVLRFLDALPSKKGVGAQLWGADWATPPTDTPGAEPKKPCTLAKVLDAAPETERPVPYGDIAELLQAVRVLVRAGGQTKWLLQDLLQPPSSKSVGQGLESHGHGEGCITALGSRASGDRSCKYSLLDEEDFSEVSLEESPNTPIRTV